MSDENKEIWMQEHTKMVGKIHKLCDNTNLLIKGFIGFIFLGIVIGVIFGFNLFVFLYLKGVIQRWF